MSPVINKPIPVKKTYLDLIIFDKITFGTHMQIHVHVFRILQIIKMSLTISVHNKT